MKTVIRTYTGEGAKDLFSLLENNAEEIKDLLRSIDGFVSYTLAHTEEGGFTITICQDKAGIDQSIQLARAWVINNASDLYTGAPQVTTGDVVIHFKH